MTRRIYLSAPHMGGDELGFVREAFETNWLSSVGPHISAFEEELGALLGGHVCALASGTAAIHLGLRLLGVGPGDEVWAPTLTFIASVAPAVQQGARPVFLDVDPDTWTLDPALLAEALAAAARAGRLPKLVIPTDLYGHPADLDAIRTVCDDYGVAVLADGAASLGARAHGRHAGTGAAAACVSFNGNKIITTGGGGMILANETLATHARHLTTTAKTPHAYEYVHDELGYNYRLPNLNAALGCAQLEQIEAFVAAKRDLSDGYAALLADSPLRLVREAADCRANYWLNTVICETPAQRDALLERTNAQGVMTRPIWRLMHTLPMYAHCRHGVLENAEWLEARVVNLPSSVLPGGSR